MSERCSERENIKREKIKLEEEKIQLELQMEEMRKELEESKQLNNRISEEGKMIIMNKNILEENQKVVPS